MVWWGNRRRARDAGEPGGRHRRGADSPLHSAPHGTSVRSRRRLPPRDARGRFSTSDRASAERTDRTRGGRNPVDGRAVSWRDFEINDDLPRTPPLPPDAPPASPGPYIADGRRHCGPLEDILYRQWDGATPPSPDVVRSIESLADLPQRLKEKLAAGIDGIYVGPGGVPELDDMGHLRGQPLPSGVATWDICAGAYGDRTIVVGDQPSPTPDVMLHEIGHALDDIDGRPGDMGSPREWQSDSVEFRQLYEQCLPLLSSEFHRQPGDIGRHEFFADAFSAIASRQRPALVDMLGGDTRTALGVMLYFNRRYGI